ncbi:hypothetical protein SYK_33850 [Pseudodesulfovibrio nedwellii]|uniref:Uncharacterized protein n=1 Tax=Pseudodesulfovibrio nedwellii TaxID=2973072 RepID=A0ABM8B5B1_9BACT|nr:hypothetical protein SYK_33850 [Pseudodesulfovibrio nedwellii]
MWEQFNENKYRGGVDGFGAQEVKNDSNYKKKEKRKRSELRKNQAKSEGFL